MNEVVHERDESRLIATQPRVKLGRVAILRLQCETIPGRLCLILLALAAVGAAHEPNEKPIEVPQNLKTASRQLCVNLQWEAAQGSMGYEIERSPTPLGPFKTLRNNLPHLTLYNDFLGEVATNFYRVRSIQTNSEGHLLPSDWSEPVEGSSKAFNQEQLLTDVQRASFDYFYLYAHPVSGLARASARRDPDICAIGASGMGIFNMGVGIERGFITRQEGEEEVLKEFRFLLQRADSYHGAFPHFINGKTGEVIPFSKYDDGADIVETAFLMEGVLFAREYFSQANPKEAEIRALADSLWRGVEWDWFVRQSNSIPAMIWHWSPRYGWKKNLYILGFNECQIVYVLGLASPTHAINPNCYWNGWESGNYARDNTQFGIHVELGGCSDVGPPLFFTQYSYMGLDPRELVFHGRSYFDHFRDFCLVQDLYAESRKNVHKGYGPLWGITASAGPDGYRAFAPGLRDNGTLAPTASLSSMPYVPAESMSCLLEMYQKDGSQLWGPFGFYDAFNFSRDWVSKTFLCIDEGPIAPMIENYRTGLCWKTFMKAAEIGPVVKMLNDGQNLRDRKNLPEIPSQIITKSSKP
jgi:exo beta-1,2-glucooligosaccharide sophorohydrolase (non-reducing end)